MPTGLQANNLSPMGFGQPNMQRAAAQQPGPGYGMPARPVAPGQQARPQAPPGGAGAAPMGPAPMGVPALYKSPMVPQPRPSQFPADAVYNRIQSAILNPAPPPPPAPSLPPMGMPTLQSQAPAGPPDMATMMQFMQQNLGGGLF